MACCYTAVRVFKLVPTSTPYPVQHSMHLFWEVAEFMANTLVFFYFGVIVAERIYVGHSPPEGDVKLLEGADWGWAILNWVMLNLIRFVTISLLKPLMNRIGAEGFSWYDVIVATWAGLRGAVGLSLGLILYLESIEEGSRIDGKCGSTSLHCLHCSGSQCRTPGYPMFNGGNVKFLIAYTIRMQLPTYEQHSLSQRRVPSNSILSAAVPLCCSKHLIVVWCALLHLFEDCACCCGVDLVLRW